jgi:hypothetical protein
MNESRRMLQQLQQQLPVRRFANGGATVLFGPPPKEEDKVAPAAGPTSVTAPSPAAGPTLVTPAAGPTLVTPPPPPALASESDIRGVFASTLGRAIDDPGLAWWQQQGLTADRLGQEMMRSGEYQSWSPYDVDTTKGLSEAERRAAVNQFYVDIFGRPGEKEGMDYWLRAASQGVAGGAGATPEQVRGFFYESPEWQTLSAFDVDKSGGISTQERQAYESDVAAKARKAEADALAARTYNGVVYDSPMAAAAAEAAARAERQRQAIAAAEAEQQRQAQQAEAERQRQAAAAAEAERQRQAELAARTYNGVVYDTPGLANAMRTADEIARRDAEAAAARAQIQTLSQVYQPVQPETIVPSPVIVEEKPAAKPVTRDDIRSMYENIFGRGPREDEVDFWSKSGGSLADLQAKFLGSSEWANLSKFDVNVDQRISEAERAAYEESLKPKPAPTLPEGRPEEPLPKPPPPVALPPVDARNVAEVNAPVIDKTVREAPVRTFDPVTGTFRYGLPAQLAQAVGSGLSFVPPTVTSRPRQLLNVAYTPGAMNYDATTGTLYQPAMSASQRFASDRAGQLGALQQAISQAGFQPSSSGLIRLQNQLRAGGFRKADGTIDTAALQAAVALLKPPAQVGPPAPSPASVPTSSPPAGFGTAPPVSFSPGSSIYTPTTFTDTSVPEDFRPLDPIRFSPS